MLPTTHLPSHQQRSRYRSFSFLPTYLRRLVKPNQMDFEYAFWLMLQLCISPKTAYRHTSYHKQTKNQWARDDPAFVVLCCAFVAVSSIAYSVTFSHSLMHSLYLLVYAIVGEVLGLGCIIASVQWYVANKFLRRPQLQQHTVEQDVEWLYSLDVHCNAWFPLFLLLGVAQLVLSPLLLLPNLKFVSALLSLALHVAALVYYHYISFLGFSALPFLQNTQILLYPVFLHMALLVLGILLGLNPTRLMIDILFGQHVQNRLADAES